METGTTLLYFIVIVAAAKIGGELVERLGQPAVLGELLAGVLLGLTPIRGAVGDHAIQFVASIGIILLLFEVGLDSELKDFVKVGRSAVLVALIGVLLPLGGGFGISLAFSQDYKTALFLGAALTATSIGITTRVLTDLRRMRSSEAKIIIGAAVLDDILGLLVLSVVLQIIATGRLSAFSILEAVAIAVVFLVAAVAVGIRFAPALTSSAQRLKTRGVLVNIAFLFCLILALIAKQTGLAEIIGAFAAGLVLATSDDRVKIQTQIKPLADVFIPAFFVLVGLQVNLAALNPFAGGNRAALLLGLALLVLGILGKLAAGLGASRGVNRLSVGVGMVPRGEVGLIFASLGLREHVIGQDLYVQLIMVVFVTTFITPILLKRVFGKAALPRQAVK